MGPGVTTIVVEQRFIVRAALASLLGNLKYRVVCSVATTADVTDASIASEGCHLAILGAPSAEDGANEAVHVRALWPDCKILLLLDSASCSDLQKLVASEIDGCIPLDASADTLSKALELIMVQKLRVMVAGGSKLRLMQGPQKDASQRLLNVIKDEALSIVIADIPKIAAKENGTVLANARGADEDMNGVSPLRKRKLSEREVQILDSLVKGHANKVIARTCAISEATVKVHMKSILRKIRVANRTQAAVWALEHGYCGDESEIEP
jgi:two-component system nitrate/nitrite response regulator NarL